LAFALRRRPAPSIKKLLLALAVVAVSLLFVLAIQTARFSSRQVEAPPAQPLAFNVDDAAERLATAITFPTISHQDSPQPEPFDSFAQFLLDSYPRVHAALGRETVNRWSLIYTWPGADAQLPPILLTAHLDVVPAESDAKWTHPPFAGRIADGFIWGRGAMDDKVGVLAILEAVEALLAAGHQPRRTIYLAFGHDEEVGGRHGARALSALLAQRRISPAYVLDEGGAVLGGVFPGIGKPVAVVGIAEKGYLTLELAVEGEGGHSMRPPRETTIGILASAIQRLQSQPFDADIRGATKSLFDFLGPEMPLLQRLAFANLWLFEPLLERRLGSSATTDATIRTTLAPTVIQAGAKENVLPARASALVNLRLLPGDTIAAAIEHVRKAIADPRVAITAGNAFEASPVSDPNAASFSLLARTIRQIFSEALVAPYLVIGATDARYYVGISANVYRFLPLRANDEDLRRMHGRDERISIENYGEAIRFYAQLIRNSDTDASERLPPNRGGELERSQ
jgi:carboxypeptidase PM20D1